MRPEALRRRVQPHRAGVNIHHTLEPHAAGLFIPMFHRRACMHNLIGRHGRIPDENNLIVGRVFVQHIPCRHFVRMAAGIVFPHALIEAVMEIEIFHVFKLGPCC